MTARILRFPGRYRSVFPGFFGATPPAHAVSGSEWALVKKRMAERAAANRITQGEQALLDEVHRLGLDADVMRARLADAQRWADEVQRLREPGSDAGTVERAQVGASAALGALLMAARFRP